MGGGELARDIDVEVSEALSEILSLIGVPGACTDARLGRRESGLLVTADEGSVTLGEDDAGFAIGSAWVDGATRMVRGFGRLVVDTADCGVALVGVLGWDGIEALGSVVSTAIGSFDVDFDLPFSFELFLAAAMSSLLGGLFLSLVLPAFLLLTASSLGASPLTTSAARPSRVLAMVVDDRSPIVWLPVEFSST